jgi:hypothetical protein
MDQAMVEGEKKKCTKCGCDKVLTEFPVDKRRQVHQTICKKCKYAQVRNWIAIDPDRKKKLDKGISAKQTYGKTCPYTGEEFTTTNPRRLYSDKGVRLNQKRYDKKYYVSKRKPETLNCQHCRTDYVRPTGKRNVKFCSLDCCKKFHRAKHKKGKTIFVDFSVNGTINLPLN